MNIPFYNMEVQIMKKIIILFLSIFSIFIFSPSAKAEWKLLTNIGDNGILKIFKNPVYAVAFSPDSRYMAAGSYDLEWSSIIAYTVGIIKIWDLDTGKEIMSLKGHKRNIYSLAFSPDGKYLVSTAIYPDENIKIWELETGKEIMSLPISVSNLNVMKSQNPNLNLNSIIVNVLRPSKTVAFSPDNKYVVTVLEEYEYMVVYKGNKIKFQEINTGKDAITLNGHFKPVTSILFSPNGKYFASSAEDGTIKLWFDF